MGFPETELHLKEATRLIKEAKAHLDKAEFGRAERMGVKVGDLIEISKVLDFLIPKIVKVYMTYSVNVNTRKE